MYGGNDGAAMVAFDEQELVAGRFWVRAEETWLDRLCDWLGL